MKLGRGLQLPELAIAEGAATPTGNPTNTFVYSTTTGTIMRWTGTAWVSVGPVVKTVTVDLGSTPRMSARFANVSVPGVIAGQKLVISVSTIVNGLFATADELELEPLIVAGHVAGTDLVTLVVASAGAPITGLRQINIIAS